MILIIIYLIKLFNDEGIIIIMCSWQFLKDDIEIDCNCDSSDISIIWSLEQELNACSHIVVTLCGIKISSIFKSENTYFSIVCKLEFVGISTFLRLLQSKNAPPHIFVILCGIKISSIVDLENAYP